MDKEAGMCRILRIFLLLIPVLSGPCCVQGLLRVSVTPAAPLFPLGSRSQLVCEVQGCSGVARIVWAQLEDRPLTASVSANATHSTATFDPVGREHEGALLCKANCGGQMRQIKSNVQVYSLPSAPEVSGPTSVLVGAQSALVCSVSDIFPPGLLTLDWLRGDQLLLRTNGEPGSTVVGSQLDFTPQRPGSERESTLEYVCRAWMDLSALSPDQRSREIRETRVQLQLLYAPLNATLTASTSPEQVLEGRGLTLTCQSDGAPPPTLVLSRNGAELHREDHAHNLSFSLSSAQLQDSAHYLCESTNQYGAARDGLNVTVRAHPLQVSVLQQVTAADSGSSLVLTCDTQGCSQSPVLTWTKTDSDPGSERGPDPDGPVLLRTTDRAGSRLVLKDLELMDSGVYSCEAQCDAVIRSGTTRVQVYSFPSDPLVSSSGPVVLGRPSVVRCSVSSVFPAARLRLQWLMGNESVQSEDAFPRSDSLQNVSSELHLDRRLQTQLLSQSLSCRVELLTEEGEVWRSRSTTTDLQLHYAPLNTALTASPSLEQVLEGRGLTLTCQSDGAPPPTLVLSRNGVELHHEDHAHNLSFSLSSAQLQDSAHYLCESTNQYGAAQDGLNVTVRAPPRNTSVLVLPSSVVFEGQNVTVCCSSVCAPPPSVYLRKLTNGTQQHSPDGNFLLVNVSAQDSGLYQVNVSNELGFEIHVFSISVRERSIRQVPSFSLSLILISSLCVAAGLSSAALFLEYVRRARKKGFYQLPQSNPQPT